MKKYIVSVASCLFALCMQSCFQDMDHPAFDYPESTGEVPTTPLKMYLPFDEEDIRDKGEWGFLVADNGNAKFVEDGIAGMAYQGAENAYILAKTPSILENNIPTIGDLTVAFWMRTTKNTSAQGLFSIPNSIKFWGNFDIFLENNNSETQAFFKVHIFNQTAKENDERWVEAKIDDIFGSEWVHLAFVYDGNTSTITVYRNGEGGFTKELPDCGKLKFNNVGASLAVGAFQFSTTPSLTSGAGAQTWAKNFPGQFDQFRLYDKVLTATEIQSIYSGKE